jgi:hypothetical protein
VQVEAVVVPTPARSALLGALEHDGVDAAPAQCRGHGEPGGAGADHGHVSEWGRRNL